jgi:hypothetical protein
MYVFVPDAAILTPKPLIFVSQIMVRAPLGGRGSLSTLVFLIYSGARFFAAGFSSSCMPMPLVARR